MKDETGDMVLKGVNWVHHGKIMWKGLEYGLERSQLGRQ